MLKISIRRKLMTKLRRKLLTKLLYTLGLVQLKVANVQKDIKVRYAMSTRVTINQVIPNQIFVALMAAGGANQAINPLAICTLIKLLVMKNLPALF